VKEPPQGTLTDDGEAGRRKEAPDLRAGGWRALAAGVSGGLGAPEKSERVHLYFAQAAAAR
jgi:hypothetical protein